MKTNAAPSAAIRARLEARLRAVHARLRPVEIPVDGEPGDAADWIMHEDLRAFAIGSHELLVEQARRLVAALSRLDAGEYGACIDCDEPIASSRLDAIPEAECCVSCASEHERRMREEQTRQDARSRWDQEE